MKQEDKELLIKEVSSRLPYRVKAKVYGWDEEKGEVEIPLRIYSINTDGYVYFETNDYDVDYLDIEECLLYLRPISSMTEEERKEFNSLCVIIYDEIKGKTILYTIETIDWLLAHHFDFRNLIEKKLALEAPEGMYNLNEK